MRDARLLRVAFLAGAVTDAIALVPMLPSFATLLWGLREVSDGYVLAMRCAASLMFGWTLLLVWASRRPLERHVVAPLTFLVVGGIVVSEIAGAVAGVVDAWRVVPTWCLQVILLVLFAWASYVPSPYRRWMYVALACGFVAVHVTHTSIVYARHYQQAAWRSS